MPENDILDYWAGHDGGGGGVVTPQLNDHALKDDHASSRPTFFPWIRRRFGRLLRLSVTTTRGHPTASCSPRTANLYPHPTNTDAPANAAVSSYPAYVPRRAFSDFGGGWGVAGDVEATGVTPPDFAVAPAGASPPTGTA